MHASAPLAERVGLPAAAVTIMARANDSCDAIAVAGRLVIAIFDTLTILLALLPGAQALRARCGRAGRAALRLCGAGHPAFALLCHGSSRHHLHGDGGLGRGHHGAGPLLARRDHHRHRRRAGRCLQVQRAAHPRRAGRGWGRHPLRRVAAGPRRRQRARRSHPVGCAGRRRWRRCCWRASRSS